jgi:ATP-dependent Lon protease
MRTYEIGLVGTWDVVAFDEVADLEKMPKEVMTTVFSNSVMTPHPPE